MIKTRKTMAAIVLSATMATCGIAAIGFAKSEHVDAFASTHYSTSAYADVGKRDIGRKVLKEGAKISASNPLSLPLTGVPQGQYYLSVDFSGIPSGQYFDVVATVGGEAFYLLTDFGTTTASSTGVIRTSKADDTILLSVTTATELTVNVYLEDLYIGDSNNYELNGVQLTSTQTAIKLQSLSAGSYTISVDLGAQVLGEGSFIYASTNTVTEPKELIKQGFFETYTGTLTIGEGVTTLYLSTNNPIPLNVSIILEKQEEVKALPTEAVTLETWMPVTYSYSISAEEAGYYKINYTSTDTKAVVETTFKTNATDFEGLTVVGDNYPLYMEANTKYYFTVMLTEATANTASVTFDVSGWEAPTIEANQIYYVPVSAAESKIQTLKLNLADNTYNLTIMDISYEQVSQGYVVAANIKANPQVDVTLTPENGYSAEVSLKGATEVSFTTHELTDTVIGITFVIPEVRNELVVGVDTQVEIPAAEGEGKYSSVVYYLTAPELGDEEVFEWLGYYDITLSPASENVEVLSTYSNIPLVNRGSSKGAFLVREEGEYALVFCNYGSEPVTVTAKATKAEGNYGLNIGAATEVTAENGTTVRYLENLVKGAYKFTVTGLNDKIAITVDGKALNFENGSATFEVTRQQDSSGIITVVFENSGENVTLNVTVMPQDVLTLGVAKTVTIAVEEYEYYTAYMLNIPKAGKYVMALNLPEGVNVSIITGYNEIVTYGNEAGIFEITSVGYIGLRVYGYGSGNTITFEALVYELNADNTLTLNTPKAISLTENNFATTYAISLAAGKYSINTQEGVDIAVNGLVTTDGVFEVFAENETVYITFINKTATEKTLNVTVEQTDSYFLELGVVKNITLPGYGYREYFINLGAGEFTITLDKAGVQVYINGELVVSETSTTGTFTTEGGVIAIAMSNYDFNEVTFTAKVTPVNMLVLDAINDVTIEAGMHSSTYYINLTSGKYTIVLTLSDGTRIQVTINGETVVAYGASEGSFTISAEQAGYVQVIFTTESEVAEAFRVEVYEA